MRIILFGLAPREGLIERFYNRFYVEGFTSVSKVKQISLSEEVLK